MNILSFYTAHALTLCGSSTVVQTGVKSDHNTSRNVRDVTAIESSSARGRSPTKVEEYRSPEPCSVGKVIVGCAGQKLITAAEEPVPSEEPATSIAGAGWYSAAGNVVRDAVQRVVVDTNDLGVSSERAVVWNYGAPEGKSRPCQRTMCTYKSYIIIVKRTKLFLNSAVCLLLRSQVNQSIFTIIAAYYYIICGSYNHYYILLLTSLVCNAMQHEYGRMITHQFMQVT